MRSSVTRPMISRESFPPCLPVFADFADVLGFTGESWAAWKVYLKAAFALPMTPEELTVYAKHTGRSAPPASPSREVWTIAGRRRGKSSIAALAACFVATEGLVLQAGEGRAGHAGRHRGRPAAGRRRVPEDPRAPPERRRTQAAHRGRAEDGGDRPERRRHDRPPHRLVALRPRRHLRRRRRG